MLLSDGVFPPGWVDQYLAFLKSVTDSYSGADMIPRRTAWAIHFASWYLPLRYDVWCTSSGGTNDETVGQLARLRTPSELFFGTDGDGTGRLTWFLRKAAASSLEHPLVCKIIRSVVAFWFAKPRTPPLWQRDFFLVN